MISEEDPGVAKRVVGFFRKATERIRRPTEKNEVSPTSHESWLKGIMNGDSTASYQAMASDALLPQEKSSPWDREISVEKLAPPEYKLAAAVIAGVTAALLVIGVTNLVDRVHTQRRAKN